MWCSNSELKAVLSALFYASSSLMMNFLNKTVLTYYNFNYPCFIMSCQMVSTIVILSFLRSVNIIHSFKYSSRDCLQLLPVSTAYFFHSTLSLISLHGMNIPMYGTIKRCTPIANLLLSVVILRKKYPSIYILFSVLLITVGCIIAGAGDLDFNREAYIFGVSSVFAQAVYLTLMQKDAECDRFIIDFLYMNATNTLPMFAAFTFLLGEWREFQNYKHPFEIPFLLTFLAILLMGTVLMYSQYLCTSLCSALTTSLVGVGKSTLQTVIGYFTFGGVKFNLLNVAGLALNLSGGISYTVVKHREHKQASNTELNRQLV